ncbi:hypothetical protein A1O1_06807 [Capronia coronata CBS 617.96]|uniref:Uncharacterized protein n=1 Tax=Capronia coronata CBS 617.96 TaxID=1182541 RepID=W9XSH4_9EURO|nr:uncharacterized protein A1O1_06807 [Capronia coronata CBS 617.96]EXJ83188.1 hypothetical protein A1O1_06807 [Capronia coronata CBS 617.96]
MRGGSGPQGLTSGISGNRSLVASASFNNGRLAAVRSRLRNREVSERKQVGDAESMINEEPNVMQPGGASEWLE